MHLRHIAPLMLGGLGLSTALPEGHPASPNILCDPKCKRNSCLSAVSAHHTIARSDCESYLRTTVTPSAMTKTVTAATTVTRSVETVTLGATTVDVTQTSILTELSSVFVTISTTELVPTSTDIVTDATTSITINGPVAKRSVAPHLPAYACSACQHNPSEYRSACHCIGATAHTVTAPRATHTVTVKTTTTVGPNGPGTVTIQPTATSTVIVDATTLLTLTQTSIETIAESIAVTTSVTQTVTFAPTPTFSLTAAVLSTGTGGDSTVPSDITLVGASYPNMFEYIRFSSTSDPNAVFYLGSDGTVQSAANPGEGWVFQASGDAAMVVDGPVGLLTGGYGYQQIPPCSICSGPYTVGQTGTLTCSTHDGFQYFLDCGNTLYFSQSLTPSSCEGGVPIQLQYTITSVSYAPI